MHRLAVLLLAFACLASLCPAPAASKRDGERLARLAALAESGRARDLPRLFEAAGPDPEVRSEWSVRRIEAVHAALRAILARDGRSVGVLARQGGRVPAGLHGVVVRATREELGSRVVELWPIWLDEGGSWERAVLAEVPRLGLEVLSHRRAFLADRVRPRLDGKDAELRRLAAVAAGQLLDDQALPRLLELFDDADAHVARKAAWALARLAGEDLGGSIADWRAWYDEQERFANERHAQLLEAARTGSEGDAIVALAALEGSRSRRHSVARALTDELWHPSQRIAARTAEALAELGSPDVLPDLMAALERPELLVQSAAWRALRTLTELELGFQVELWRARLLR